MIRTSARLGSLLFFLGLVASVYPALVAAQSPNPREQLQQYVAELQKNPNDPALREKIIKLVLTLEPKPAIPKEANRPFVMAVTFQKEAKDAAGYELAIRAYNEALLLAPWWPEAYWNLSLVQEAAGRYDNAMRTLKLYLLTNPQDASQAETRLYALEAKKTITEGEATAKAKQETEKAERFRRSLVGTWVVRLRVVPTDPRHDIYSYYRLDVTGSNEFAITWVRGEAILPFEEKYQGTLKERNISGSYASTQGFRPYWDCDIKKFSGTFSGTISEDGRTISVTLRSTVIDNPFKCLEKMSEYKKTFQREGP